MSERSVARASAWLRRCAALTLLCLLGFVLFTAVAMWLYPGGNWLEPNAPGHRFFYNFFCDLTQPLSLSGVNNRWGAVFARMGMWCFAVALAGFFWSVPLHFTPRRASVTPNGSALARRWVRALGECSVLGVALVPLLPSQVFGHFHGLLALSAGVVGMAAAVVAVIALWRALGAARWLAGVGALALAVSIVDATLFAWHLNDSAPPPFLLPAAQKVAALLLCAWIVGVAWPLLRQNQASVTHRP